MRAALLAVEAGADGITAHLREDRHHIVDDDIQRLKAAMDKPLHFEMAATSEMVAFALKTRPHACCLVPERCEERTTEGGLDVRRAFNHLKPIIAVLTAAGSRVSLFIEADAGAIEAAAALHAPVVELHTGTYCEAVVSREAERITSELDRLKRGAALAASVGLEVHAGHGLTYDSVGPVAAIPEIVELNIGHFLVGDAIFIGLPAAIRQMRNAMEAGRQTVHA